MKIEFEAREDFRIFGCSVETALEQSETDVSTLINQYSAKWSLNAEPCYGLMWYTDGHSKYRYMIGKEHNVGGLEEKVISHALYAKIKVKQNADINTVWADFFFKAIPNAGYKPDFEHGFFFEYYPKGLNGNFELWTPVIKQN